MVLNSKRVRRKRIGGQRQAGCATVLSLDHRFGPNELDGEALGASHVPECLQLSAAPGLLLRKFGVLGFEPSHRDAGLERVALRS
jgi:hypothetical protein